MRLNLLLALLVGLVFLFGCQKETTAPHVAELSVDFSWVGMQPCGWGNPEIHIDGVPENTTTLSLSMYDHAYSHDHGTVRMPFTGEKTIHKDRFKTIQGPCPVYSPGRYEITIKARDNNGTIIGRGSTTRSFPEE